MTSKNSNSSTNSESIELFPSLNTSTNTLKSTITPSLIQTHIPELIPNTNMCETCKLEKYKYKCPACSFKSCSLKCSKSHKELLNCTGERDPTKFIGKKLYSEINLTEDFNYLEGLNQKLNLSENDLKRFSKLQKKSKLKIKRRKKNDERVNKEANNNSKEDEEEEEHSDYNNQSKGINESNLEVSEEAIELGDNNQTDKIENNELNISEEAIGLDSNQNDKINENELNVSEEVVELTNNITQVGRLEVELGNNNNQNDDVEISKIIVEEEAK